MVRQVREVAPEERQPVESVALAWSVKEPSLNLSPLSNHLAELFEIYRRHRTRLVWNDSAADT
jgi:hypothetical protein